MSGNLPDSTPPKAGGLWGRLFGVHVGEEKKGTATKENANQRTPETAAAASATPDAKPAINADFPQAIPIESEESLPALAAVADEQIPTTDPGDEVSSEFMANDAFKQTREEIAGVAVSPPNAPTAEILPTVVVKDDEVAPTAPPPTKTCPSCGAQEPLTNAFCGDCGWMFPRTPSAVSTSKKTKILMPEAVDANSSNNQGSGLVTEPIKGRYQIEKKIMERLGVRRYLAKDLNAADATQSMVTLICCPATRIEELVLEEADEPAGTELTEDDFMPTFDEPAAVAELDSDAAVWPSVAWEKAVLEKANHPAFPRMVDHFVEGELEYLVEEFPDGQLLWDAWDDPNVSSEYRYGLLIQIAEGLQRLHQAGAIIEGLRPDIVRVSPDGQVRFHDLSDLLPLPLPPNPPIRGTLYTAPELVLNADVADARADLYSFGAMLYALEYLHHSLEEKDFERPFYPHLITEKYPDVHPAFNRLIIKTFTRDLNIRFPTDEAKKIDPTGFTELIENLRVCQRTFERVRLDIAAWTTTGMVRSGNEDAFAFLHAVESRQDELSEYALVLLADGMGGYEAGEVAAAIAIHTLRLYLLQQPLFAALAGKPPEEAVFDVDECKKLLVAALKHANKEVFNASRTPGKGKRGMGCTAEAVYIDDRHLVVGHVGDSRTYHLSNGRLVQLTRDQTFVNRMVELGMLTAEEAEHHDRKNELQQAIGGQPEVEPGIYDARLRRGDWVIVCSDGLTNHIPSSDLEKMLLRETANSAEEAARRLLNLVNLRGATDNATIVVVRAS